MTDASQPRLIGLGHPEFEKLVQRVIDIVEKDRLEEMRRDFHTRLRITLTHPDNTELIEDLWDFFYDWCLFEQKIPDTLDTLGDESKQIWTHLRDSNLRGLYTVTKAGTDAIKIKEMYGGDSHVVNKHGPNDFIGISRGDVIEGRLVEGTLNGKKTYSFLRKPSYHPSEVHAYIKKKVKQFKKADDFTTYQQWLWLLVGMSLKHRIYHQMPIDKIYDDNSRI